MRTPLAILAGLIGVSVLQAVYYYPRLQDVVVSHVGPDGPDGWMSRDAYLATMLGMELLLVVLVAALPMLATRRRARVRVPNPDYWLAPERREATVRTFARQLLWLAVIVLAGNVLIWQRTLDANAGTPHLVPIGVAGLVGMTVAASLVWVWHCSRSFALPRE